VAAATETVLELGGPVGKSCALDTFRGDLMVLWEQHSCQIVASSLFFSIKKTVEQK
jgi:hypothetical protein